LSARSEAAIALEAASVSAGGEQRRGARRAALLLGLVALAMYAGFIVLTVYRAQG
jgi:uncharacterized membrane protein (DUF485 family)